MSTDKMKDNDPNTALTKCLREHCIMAEVIDCDHYRVRGGLVVETDYIIRVQPNIERCPDQRILFEAFCLSKNYAEFRTFTNELRDISQKILLKQNQPHKDIIQLCRYCETAYNLIDSERTKYIGKVNFMFVKVMAKQRKQLINDLLVATCAFFPQNNDAAKQWSKDDYAFVDAVVSIVEAFFLTDHIDEKQCKVHHPEKHALSSDNERGTKGKKTLTGQLTTPFKKIATSGKEGLSIITGAAGKATETVARQIGIKSEDESTATVQSSIIVPLSTRSRLSDEKRDFEEGELLKIANDDAKLSVEDDATLTPTVAPGLAPSYSNPQPTIPYKASDSSSSDSSVFSKLHHYFRNNPIVFVGVVVGCLALIKVFGMKQFVMDGDLFALIIFATFCIGLHTPRPIIGGYDVPSSIKSKIVVKKHEVVDRSGRLLLRRSIITAQVPSTQIEPSSATEGENNEVDVEHPAIMGSPMAKFPVGAKIGSHHNCWSEPDPCDFHVRGPNYFNDKKKVASGDYIFPCRGLDLFLTDSCPENVGSNPGVFGGRLREMPSFIINFRLPWGVLVFYYEIPLRFVPYLRCAEENEYCNTTEKEKMIDNIKNLSPPDRTVARFLMGDGDHRNKTFKIVPVVVDGPWVVKSVVGGKPALIGKKVPINYVYQPPSDKHELYLEADLDIAASSAARGILSVTRSYTQVLTLNLGFVVEACEPDELPEQMLVGARLHGIDPLTAPSYPNDDSAALLHQIDDDDESGDIRSVDG